jgi:hypothetical protein
MFPTINRERSSQKMVCYRKLRICRLIGCLILVQVVACTAAVVECRAAIIKRRGGGTSCCSTSSCRFQRPGDEVWLISCRDLPCFSCGGPAPPANVGDRLSYWRYDWGSRNWRRSDLAAFLATEQLQLATSLWVHGDRVESSEGFSQGWETYQQLVRGADVGSMRFVIWSWPSEQVLERHPARDARIKAFRTNAAGYYLGGLLRELEPTTRVGLIAFSFGSRVVTGALHVLAGGEMLGHALPGEDPHPPRRHNVALMAAGVDHDWLRPGRPHGLAMTQVESMLLVNNYFDRVLRFYPKLWGGQALGYVGLYLGGSMAPQAEKIRQVNAGAYVGKQHSRQAYIYSGTVMSMVREYALYRIMPAVAAVADNDDEVPPNDSSQSPDGQQVPQSGLATAESGDAA